ncbi:bacteriocin-protection protein [bacterium]|nr:MAG: bacteriocin-protection protein [bacterium]
MEKPKAELPVILFEKPEEWIGWLKENHESEQGIWMRFAKKASALESISYAEAMDGALCYGWIDGQVKKYDEDSWIQKFTPRRSRSLWSKINTEKVARLIESGLMQEAGLREVERAQQDGRWEAAYDSPSKAEVPSDFAEELEKNEKAKEFFATLNKQNRYAIIWRIQTAKKAETRAKRIGQLVEMLEKGEKIH